MDKLYNKAIQLGATDFGVSMMKNKRFYIIFNNKKINFGSRFGRTFIDHKNKKIRDAWIARHSKIKNRRGDYVIYDKYSPAFWSRHILW